MGKVLTPDDITALIHLLGDDDAWVKEQARSTLRAAGDPVRPFLESARVDDDEQAVRVESSTLLEDIVLDGIERDWVALQAADEGEALLEGAFLLERLIHQEREAEQAAAREELDAISAAAREAIPATGALTDRVEALRDFLHETCGFHGNVADYYDAENSFLTRVLARRTGIPITLAHVYMEVGSRTGVPLVGVGMPMHFLVAYRSGGGYRYLDPFHGGREVNRGECLLLLERAGFEPAEAYLQPAPVVAILERMARNLIVIYQNSALERELRLARRFVTMLTGEIV